MTGFSDVSEDDYGDDIDDSDHMYDGFDSDEDYHVSF